jgi:Txe/YoeB family toxin of Txe-Axe toxin-antitoxin module
MKSIVNFGESKLKEAYEKLKTSTYREDSFLYKWIKRAIDDLRQNAFCGIQIPKHLIPKEYITKYEIDNLWKYDFPQGWRLLYSIANDKISIISIILEWLDHKEYERRFNY